jgi:hypothetical protein
MADGSKEQTCLIGCTCVGGKVSKRSLLLGSCELLLVTGLTGV